MLYLSKISSFNIKFVIQHANHYTTYAVPGLLMEVNWFMVLNATFNNISVISWWSVLLVEETGVSGENHRLVASH
jgi:hypothetical protein